MSISILKNDGLNRFEIYSDGELAGFAEFKIENQMISYTHTEIDPKFGGQGLGSQLIKEVLDEALEQNLEVAPYCSQAAFLPFHPAVTRACKYEA